MTDASEDPLDLVGHAIDGCEVLRVIGRGQHTLVYSARHLPTGTLHALKVLEPQASVSHKHVMRFLRESECLARLDHPRVVKIDTIGADHHVRFMRLELVEGDTLERLVEGTGAIPWKPVASIGVDVAEALAHVHSRHVVHGDLRPSKIRIATDGHAKLVGFSRARRTDLEVIGARAPLSDAAGDIRALGATLFHALSAPFATSAIDAPFHAPDMPDSLREVLDRCLGTKDGEGFRDAGEVAAALRALLAG